MHQYKNINITQQRQLHHSIDDITDMLRYDYLLTQEQPVYDNITLIRKPEIAVINEGDVGLFGIVASKQKKIFIVLGKADNGFHWTREIRSDGCKTFKRRLTYERRGLKDSLYVIGFFGTVDNLLESL